MLDVEKLLHEILCEEWKKEHDNYIISKIREIIANEKNYDDISRYKRKKFK